MNTVRWEDGSKARFENLTYCYDAGNEWYYCNGGYVSISNPMGIKVCELKDINWMRGKYWYEPKTCRYK
jgi:hypothetical protein